MHSGHTRRHSISACVQSGLACLSQALQAGAGWQCLHLGCFRLSAYRVPGLYLICNPLYMGYAST
jgi:hypothetical protein